MASSLLRLVLLGVSVAAAVGTADGAGYSVCTTCKGPLHSWDRFPVSFHSGEANTNAAGEYTPEELAVIKNFPLVTIEKMQGSLAKDASGQPVFLWQDEATLAAARQVKRANPNASVVIWLDTELIYTGWNWPNGKDRKTVNHTFNPDAHKCGQAHFRPAEFVEQHTGYLLKNSSGLPALESWSGCHIYDHTKQEVRDYWRDEICLKNTASGLIDGCGADFSNHACGGRNVSAAVCTAWKQGHEQMMRETTAALGDGLLVGKAGDELGDYVNAVLNEGCPAENSTILLLQGLARKAATLRKRMVYQCHTFGYCAYGCNRSILDSAAAFLIGAGDDHYLASGGWYPIGGDHGNFSTHWFPDLFDRPLGEPVSDGQYDSVSAIWSRTFKSGTKVTFNAATKKGSIDWANL